MKKSRLLGAATVCLAVVSCFNANAAILTFEDLATSAGTVAMPESYAGFDWSDLGGGAVTCSTYFTQDTGYCRGLASGDVAAYSGGGLRTLSRSGGEIFDFNGAYFTAAWNHNANLELMGSLGGVEKYSFSTLISDDVATYFDLSFLGIDTLTISNSGGVDAGTPGFGSWLAIDDFNYAVSSVPLPSAIWLFGTGMLGLVGMARRKKA